MYSAFLLREADDDVSWASYQLQLSIKQMTRHIDQQSVSH